MIRRYYPRACGHLDSARALDFEMTEVWKSVIDGEFLDEEIVTDPDRTGRIVISARWPAGSRETLTDLFRRCVDELWGCLDSLVAESVEQFSVLQRPRNCGNPDIFPSRTRRRAWRNCWPSPVRWRAGRAGPLDP